MWSDQTCIYFTASILIFIQYTRWVYTYQTFPNWDKKFDVVVRETDWYSEELFQMVLITEKVFIPKCFLSFIWHASIWKFIILNGFYLKWLLFWGFFLFPRAIKPKFCYCECRMSLLESLFSQKVVIVKGHHSNIWILKHVVFWKNDIWRQFWKITVLKKVKFSILIVGIKSVWNNDPSEYRPAPVVCMLYATKMTQNFLSSVQCFFIFHVNVNLYIYLVKP